MFRDIAAADSHTVAHCHTSPNRHACAYSYINTFTNGNSNTVATHAHADTRFDG